MSTFRQPVGPESSRTYWRRRILFLLLLLAIIVAVILIFFRPGADAEDQPSKPAPTTGATQTPDAGGLPPLLDGAEPDDGEAKDCKAKDVVVEAITDSSSYSAGQSPKLSFAVTNVGKSACILNGGTADQLFTIKSGSERYWVSSDCQTDASKVRALLQPDTRVVSAAVVWDRTRSSAETCDAVRPQVTAGGASYHLTVSVGGFTSEKSKQFLLN